jgi:hypothetical protein
MIGSMSSCSISHAYHFQGSFIHIYVFILFCRYLVVENQSWEHRRDHVWPLIALG